MRAAIIVAHPDDETIWAGGLVLRNPGWEWIVLSLCRAHDPDRAPKFRRACDRLGATGVMSDLDDGAPPKPIDASGEITDRILAFLPGTRWDLCLTHGRNGEYGHERHRQVHTQVLRLVRDGTIGCDEFWAFAYECDTAAGACKPAPWADVLVELTAAELAEKKRVVRELYGYAEQSFEVNACISPECFKRLKGPQKD